MNSIDRKPRQLIVCCDGTNNTLTGRIRDTNVLRVFELLSQQRDPEQVLYYDTGVGSPDNLPPTDLMQRLQRLSERVAALVSGAGIFENIAQAYTFLMREHRAGDQIWLFGFSRGAFTARSVAGMISLFGLIRPEHEPLLPTLLRVYFSPEGADAAQAKPGMKCRSSVAEQIRSSFTSTIGGAAEVHFVGVWDTVAAVGFPGLAPVITSPATVRNKRFRHVRHALSLDEHRISFLPRLYAESDFGGPADAQSLRQVWFQGGHSDVGGGYPVAESGLPRRALAWMVEEAIACGLRISLPPPEECQDVVHDEVYENPLWALAGLVMRDTNHARLRRGRRVEVVPVGADTARAAAVTSVWDMHRSFLTLCLWGALAYGGLIASGACVWSRAPDDWWLYGSEGPRAAFLLAESQLEALWAPSAAFGFTDRSPRAALLLDLVFVVGYLGVAARFCSRAFQRLAGSRQAGDRVPVLAVLGLALPLLVVCDTGENLLGVLAFTVGENSLGRALLWVGSLGALGKLVGLLGCLVLGGVGAMARAPVRDPDRQALNLAKPTREESG